MSLTTSLKRQFHVPRRVAVVHRFDCTSKFLEIDLRYANYFNLRFANYFNRNFQIREVRIGPRFLPVGRSQSTSQLDNGNKYICLKNLLIISFFKHKHFSKFLLK
jgi:hypothetical protein